MSITERQRAQIEAIAERRRAKETCKRGHNNWRIRKDGTRFCKTCGNDRNWYCRRGLKYV